MSHQTAKVPLLACAIAKPQCSNADSVNCLLLTIPLFPFLRAQQPLVGHGIQITEASRSHSDTPHSVGLWKSDRSDAETSTWQHSTYKRQTSMFPAGFESTIPASEQPQTHAWDRAATVIGPVAYQRGGGGSTPPEFPKFWQSWAEFPVPSKIHP
jgi:hypothetical protein